MHKFTFISTFTVTSTTRSNNHYLNFQINDVSVASTEDPEKLDVCIQHLITNLPTSPMSSPPPMSPTESPPPASSPRPRAKRATPHEEFSQKRHKRRTHSTDVSSEPYTPNGGEYIEAIFRPKMRTRNLQMES